MFSALLQEIQPSSIQTRFIAIALSPSFVLTHFVPTFPKCPLKLGPMIAEDDASVKQERVLVGIEIPAHRSAFGY